MAKEVITVFALIIWHAILVAKGITIDMNAIDYSTVQSTGKFCPQRDSCRETRNTRGPATAENDWKKRNCFCDQKCATYGDCCIDAPAFNHTEQKRNFKLYQCKNLKQYGNIYVRSECAENWTLSNIRQACQNPDTQVSDPFGTTPVTNAVSGITYKNYYCAVCNDDSYKISFWKPRLECPTLTSYYTRFKNITLNFIQDKLVFDEARKGWGVKIDTGGVPVFHECHVDPAVPDQLLNQVRECSGKNTIGDCPPEYPDEDTRSLCQSYTAMVFEPNAAYRNVHCAICNNASLDRLICLNLGPFGRFNWQQNFNSYSFAVLFDIGGDQRDTVGYAKQCSEGFLYDPFFRKCRNVVCAKENEIYRNGACYDPKSTTSTSSTSTTTKATGEIPDVETTKKFLGASTSAIPATTATSSSSSSTEMGREEEEEVTQFSSEFLECPKFQLQKEEFELRDDDSVFVKDYDKHYPKGHFEVDPGSGTLTICAIEGRIHGMKFSPEMGYVTFVCLGVSVICCFLHILASLVTPELQNLSGKNLLSLTISLLGSYTSFIASMFLNSPNSPDCYVLAVLMYFFFLASFFWMLIIAFDVCRTLKLATTQLRLTAGAQWKKFGLYSLVGWMAPIVLVLTAVTMDLAGPESEFQPGFGRSELCWFSQKKSLLVFFALPFALIVAFNLMLFIASASMVYNTTRSNSKVTACGPGINFHLYLRLAVIMGITWTTGLVAGFIDSEAVWFGFIALNTLQGLFIFIAFTCTKKVYKGIKVKLLGPEYLEDPTWKWTSSTKKSNLDSNESPVGTNTNTKSKNGTKIDDSLRGKTVYTVSNYQVNCSLNQNSFNGRYF